MQGAQLLILRIVFPAMLLLGFGACSSGANDNNSHRPKTESIEEDAPRTHPSDDSRKAQPAPKVDQPDAPCTYNGHALHVGKKGGCYYFYDGKKKEYVDRSFCNSCK
jgi:hypothetical protein